MTIFKLIKSFIRGGTDGFSEYENFILNKISDALPICQREALALRRRNINLVQRLDGGREVNSYAMKGGKPTFDAKARLSDNDDELYVASVTIEGHKGSANKVKLLVVKGQFFSLLFDAPTEYAEVGEITNIEVSLH